MEFRAINLPSYFTDFLRENMQTSSEFYRKLPHSVRSDISFRTLVDLSFKDIHEDTIVDYILKVIGWNGFRNRMTSVFIYHIVNGAFPFKSDLGLIQDIINLETKLRPFSVEGYSRAFLLGFYLKVLKLDSKDNTDIDISDDIIELLSLSGSRIVKIDWLVIMLLHFKEFLGLERLKKILQTKIKYEDIYSLLSDEQKEIVMDNMLSYGSSIGDEEIFCSSLV